jgi:hypothetical protein
MSKTLFCNLPYTSEVSIGIEQVEQCRVGRPKLTYEWVGFRSQCIRDFLRVLMQTRRGDNKTNAIAAASSGSSSHLL